MRAVIQRVTHASVVSNGALTGKIGRGLLVLLAVEDSDTNEDAQWLAAKIVKMRIFDDAQGVMNLSVEDIGGEILLVSQFTLFASTRKGNRPSWLRASKADIAIPMYEYVKSRLAETLGKDIPCGVFGADMKVELLNDGPVTVIIDTKYKE